MVTITIITITIITIWPGAGYLFMWADSEALLLRNSCADLSWRVLVFNKLILMFAQFDDAGLPQRGGLQHAVLKAGPLSGWYERLKLSLHTVATTWAKCG